MIIISQDKDNIVNFNNIVSIVIDEFKFGSNRKRITAETLGFTVVLGDYKTEKRAKEVLKSIVEVYQANKTFECTNDNVQSDVLNEIMERKLPLFTYEMPEK